MPTGTARSAPAGGPVPLWARRHADHLALSEPPRWADERLNRAGQFHLTSGLDGVSRAVNEATRRLLPAEPTISFDTPSNIEPSRAPAGKAVVRIQLLEVPYRPRGDAGGQIDVGDGSWTGGSEDSLCRPRDRHRRAPCAECAGGHSGADDFPQPDEIARFPFDLRYGDPYGGSHELAQSYILRPLAAQPGTARRCRSSTCWARRPGRGRASAAAPVISWPSSCCTRAD